MELERDKKSLLQDIRDVYNTPLVEQLLAIQAHMYEDEKSSSWVRKLKCFVPKEWEAVRQGPKRQRLDEQGKVLKRIEVQGDKPRSPYVAVSYVWNHDLISKDDEGYRIEIDELSRPSTVPCCVWRRTISFWRHYRKEGKVCPKGIWIDQESINQKDMVEKQRAMQSMDQVYRNSEYPLGLIFTEIHTQKQINMLEKLLLEKYVYITSDGPRLRMSNDIHQVLELLGLITSDMWWTRAWIFQEEYLASLRMTLLIPHASTLEPLKRMKKMFGNMEGELKLEATDFRKQTTLFCLAYGAEAGVEFKSRGETCDIILSRAAKYTTLLEYSDYFGDPLAMKPMSTIIFKEVEERNITEPFDMLAIIANCCGYPFRLDTEILKKTECSLSLSLLVLYLLNGEILRNEKDGAQWLNRTVSEYLGDRSLDTFRPPVEQMLTFTKSCRFVDVEFSPEGITTKGLFWKLGKRINASRIDLRNCRDNKQILQELASRLETEHHAHLAGKIDHLTCQEQFTSPYKGIMAAKLSQAIQNGEILYLGCIRGKPHYEAVFFRGSIDDSSQESLEEDSEESLEEDSQESVEEDSQESMEGDSQDSIGEDSQESLEEDSEESLEEDSQDSVGEDSQESLEGDSQESLEEDSQDDSINATTNTKQAETSYVFTAWDDGHPSDSRRALPRIEKYVSIEVDLEGRFDPRRPPRLRTKRWINGLCFFSGHCPEDVLFPWPDELMQ